MKHPVKVFKCPCEGNRFVLATKPITNPTKTEKLEYGELIAKGCQVVLIELKEFRKGNWNYCTRHF